MKSLWIALALALSSTCHAQQAKPVVTSRPELTKAQERALGQLIKDLGSSDPRTLDEAFQGLIRMGPKAVGAIGALTRKLDGGRITYSSPRYRSRRHSFHVGGSAVMALRSIGKAAVPALIGALRHKDEEIRVRAARAIVEIGHPIDLKHWLDLLHDNNKSARIIASRQVGKAKDASGVKPLAKLLKDGDRDVRIEAAKALGELGNEKAVDFLIACLPEATSHQYAPSFALARLGRPAIQAVIQKFATFEGGTRRVAANAIHHCDARALKDLLVPCLGSKHGQLREAALYAMLTHKLPEAFEAAKGMTDDSYWVARYTAARCLGEMADKRTADSARLILLKMAREDKDAKVRSEALSSAIVLRDKAPADTWKTVRTLLKDESPRVRRTATEAAYAFWSPELVPAMLALLKDPEPSVRADAAAVLGGRRVKEAIPQLMHMLDDSSDHCALYAGYALAKYKTDETLGALIEKVKDTKASRANRRAAATALCYAKSPKAVEALIVALEDDIDPSSVRIWLTLKAITGQNHRANPAKWRAWYEEQKQDKEK